MMGTMRPRVARLVASSMGHTVGPRGISGATHRIFDLGGLHPDERPSNLDALLDAEAALIPRMILILRKLARIRDTAGRSAPTSKREKVGRNDPCPCGSGKKYKRCCARAC